MKIKFIIKLVFVSISTFITAHTVAQTHTLVQGWNLEGNDNGAVVDPNVIFGNAMTPTTLSPSVTTVWTWNKNSLQWNFFAPSMTPAQLSTYAASKQYGVLANIQAGEGFWVNVKNAVSVNLAAGTNSIVGTWNDGNTNNSVITFFANGDYIQAKSVTTNAGASAGIEDSTYTWNPSTGAFAPVCPAAVDTNGSDGFCNGSSATTFTFTFVNSKTMTFTNSHNQSGTLTRVVDSTIPLVGTWYLGNDNHHVIITFFSNGDYVLSQSVTSGYGYTQPGLEHGTYTWNPNTGSFSTGGCPPIDTNG